MSLDHGHQPTPDAAMSIGVVTGCLGIFGFLCPGVLDAIKHDSATVRTQQAKAAIASLGLGAAGSAFTKTPWPFLVSLVMVGLLVWEFETHQSAGDQP